MKSHFSVFLHFLILLSLLIFNFQVPIIAKSKGEITDFQGTQAVIADSDFIFTNNEFNYDFQGYLERKSGLLSNLMVGFDGHQMAFSDYLIYLGHYYTINPKILLAILQVQSGLVNSNTLSPEFSKSVDINSGGLSSFLVDYLDQIASQLSAAYYFYKYPEYGGFSPYPNVNYITNSNLDASMFALQTYFQNNSHPSLREQDLSVFINTYTAEFPQTVLDKSPQITNDCNSMPVMQLPFPGGESWQLSYGRSGMAHGDLLQTDSSSVPSGFTFANFPAALDFVPPSALRQYAPNAGLVKDAWVASPFTSSTVTYAAQSLVIATQTNSLWSALFYHIHTQDMSTQGKLLTKGDLRIGHPSNSILKGGSSPWSHVHFAVRCNGEYKPAEGLVFSGWTVVRDRDANGNLVQNAWAMTEDNSRLQRSGDWVLSKNYNYYDCTKIDVTPPTGNWVMPFANENSVKNGQIFVSILASDSGGCGLASIQITASYQEWWNGTVVDPYNQIALTGKPVTNKSPSWYWHPLKQFRSSDGQNIEGLKSFVWDLCKYNLKTQNALTLSFDLYDKAGNHILANDGFRVLDFVRTNPCSTVTDNALEIKTSGGGTSDSVAAAANQAVSIPIRFNNSGTSTWENGYKLVFVGGEQMGAPLTIDVPVTAANANADLTISLIAPSSAGNHTGYFQLRNPQGTYFGPKISVKIMTVVANTGNNGHILLFDTSPASPTSASIVHLVARIKAFSEFRSMRIIAGNDVFEMSNFKQVGDQLEMSADWNTGTLPRASYSLILEVAVKGDNDWSRAERQVKSFILNGTPSSINHPPERPTLVSPYDWFLKDSAGASASVELCASPVNDPEGDPVQYYFDVNGAVISNSGWVSSLCWTNTYSPNGYAWRVKARDSQGAETDWSQETWHFNVASGGVTVGGVSLYYNPSLPNDTHICVPVTYGGIQGPDVRAFINLSADGSANGLWKQLDHYGPNASPDCTTSNVHGFWIRSPEYETGSHLIRVDAIKPDSGASDSQTYTYVIPYIRPNSPRALSPANYENNATWWNNTNITFSWDLALRTQNQVLRVSLSPDIWNDPAPLLNVNLDGTTTQYIYQFDQDYDQLYWSVKAQNSAGTADSGSFWFGIDRVNPTCTLPSLPIVSYENVFQVNWNGLDNAAGIRSYDIQVLDSERGVWADWLLDVPGVKTYDLFTGLPGHTYGFRCRAMDEAGNMGDYPTMPDISVKIDPSARPASPWWKSEYSSKRNLTILNNMSGMSLPAGYPVRIHFDNTTTPTAGEIYNASLSNPKCNDLRVVANDVNEISRYMLKCSSNEIEFWIRSPQTIGAGASDTTSLQLYYGNASPGPILGEAGNVFYPSIDANTIAAWYMTEGQGSQVYDQSGHGHTCTLDGTTSWITTNKFISALHFLGGTDGPTVNCGASSDYNLQSFTYEFYFRSTNNNFWGRLAGNIQQGSQRWLISINDRKPSIWIWTENGGGGVTATRAYDDGAWHHLALTVSNLQVKLYMDGQLDGTSPLPGNIRSGNLLLTLGSAEDIQRSFAEISGVRLSNIARTDFSYANFIHITAEPAAAAGLPIAPQVVGSPDLIVLGLNSYPDPSGGALIEAIVQNQGNLSTQNGFFTDLYLNHMPDGTGDLTGSMRFWVNDPIAAGSIVTLTSLVDMSSLLNLDLFHHPLAPASEITGTIYTQVDSSGTVLDQDRTNNISEGNTICLTTADSYENDEAPAAAALILAGATQKHNFQTQSDQDWVKFSAVSGEINVFETISGESSVDTIISVYDQDGTTLLAMNDDGPNTLASHLEWRSPSSGIYYLQVKSWNPIVNGCGTGYDLHYYNKRGIFIPYLTGGNSNSAVASTPTPTSTYIPKNTNTPTPTTNPTATPTPIASSTAIPSPTSTATPIPTPQNPGVWQKVYASGLGVLSVSISPDFENDHTVMAATYSASASDNNVYRSSDGGDTWQNVYNGIYFWHIRFSPNYVLDHTIWAVGGPIQALYRSTDKGLNWTKVDVGTNNNYILAISPNYSNDRTIFVGDTNGKVYKSTDAGATWFGTGLSQPGWEVRSMVISPNYAVDHTIFIGLETDGVWYTGGIWRSVDGGSNWQEVSSNLVFQCVEDLVISPAYAIDHTIFANFWGAGMFKSTDGGSTWIAINSNMPNVRGHTLSISQHYTSDQTVYLGTWGENITGGVFMTNNGGATWNQINSGLTSFFFHEIATYTMQNGMQISFAAGEFATGGGLWRLER